MKDSAGAGGAATRAAGQVGPGEAAPGHRARSADALSSDLVRLSADGMVVVDGDGVVRFANPAAAALLGRPPEQVVGLHLGYPTAGSDGATVELHRGGAPPITVEMRAAATTWQGEAAFVVNLRDISAKVAAEAELRKSRDRLDWLYQSVGEGIFSVRMPDRVVDRVNRRVEEIFGYSAAELVGQTTEQLYPSRAAYQAFGAELERELGKGANRVESRVELRRKSGEIFPALVTTTVRHEGTDLSDVISVVQDLSERERTLEQLRLSDQRFRLALRSSSLVVATTDDELRYNWIHNPHPDFAPASVIGKRDDEIDGGPEIDRFVAFKQRVLDTGEAAREEFAFERSDRTHYYDVLAEPLRSAGGAVVGVATAALDVTARKDAEQELAERERLLSRITDNMLDMVSLADLDGTITYASPSHRQIGYDPAELLGRRPLELVHPDDHERVAAELAAGLAMGGPRRVEYRLVRPDGETVWLESAGVVLTDEQDRPSALIFSTRDITARRALLAQLAQADRLSSMGMLAAGIAHEINNPLSYVLYNLQSIDGELPRLLAAVRKLRARATTGPSEPPLAAALGPTSLEDLADRFADALEGSRRIREIARGLSTFSRVEKDRRVSVDLNHVVETALSMAHNEVKYRARLVKELGAVPTVLGSEGRLSQVFLNLIINAGHAIDEGNVARHEIRVRTWTEAGAACAEVRDTGSGIDPEHLSKLFEPFFTTKPIGTGSGLGLAITKSIVEGYGGTIEVESEVGRGSSFVVRLPPGREEALAGGDQEADDGATSAGGRVLVVDDEERVRLAVVRVLREHETVAAASGAEAQRILEQDQAFDLVVCDVMMSDLSGMDLHRWLAEEYPELARRVIFITGGAFTPRAREYLNQVDNLRIEKPFDPVSFRKIVRDMVRLARSTEAS